MRGPTCVARALRKGASSYRTVSAVGSEPSSSENVFTLMAFSGWGDWGREGQRVAEDKSRNLVSASAHHHYRIISYWHCCVWRKGRAAVKHVYEVYFH